MLICPVCKKPLKKVEKQYVCTNNHQFDIAKQGYTNLYLKSSKHSGDNKDMVKARTSFLNLHYYDPLVKGLLDIIRQIKMNAAIDTIVDAGCGEGYYTNLIEQSINASICAFDLSKDALKYAAQRNKQIHYYLSSIFELPIDDRSTDLLLNIFAPLASEEFNRILSKGGYLIKVDPNSEHLKEMKTILYDSVYDNEVLDLNVNGFTLQTYQEITYTMELDQKAINALFMMTPYYYKTSKSKADELKAMTHLCCTASFMIYIYRKN